MGNLAGNLIGNLEKMMMDKDYHRH